MFGLSFVLLSPGHPAPSRHLLAREYRAGETLVYRMTASNQQRSDTIRYEATATGRVERNPSGAFVERFEWSPGGGDFRQELSLEPGVPPQVPDLSRAPVRLIGPITDLLTFYADLWLAAKQPALSRARDHVYVPHGSPASWADGAHTLIGEDSIDFDITLSEVNAAEGTARVLVRHVPPPKPEIRIPAPWMSAPVSDAANNWVEVTKTGERKYLAEVGKETFDVNMLVSLADGKLLSASMDNPVSVLARTCIDAAATECSEPERYQIRRQVDLRLER
jgi:hypothetical protein